MKSLEEELIDISNFVCEHVILELMFKNRKYKCVECGLPFKMWTIDTK